MTKSSPKAKTVAYDVSEQLRIREINLGEVRKIDVDGNAVK